MSILQEISKRVLAVATLPPEQRNGALTEVLIYIEEVQYDMVLEQKNLIMSVIEDLIAENDADQIAKSKLVFVEDVEEQIAPTKKTRAKKVVTPVAESESEDLPDYIKEKPLAKDLPEPVRKLIGLRRKQQGDKSSINLDSKLAGLLLFDKTLEGSDFWIRLNDSGNLTEFKKLYGNKGEKVDELVEFAELSEFVENEFLSKAESENLPDTINRFTPVKDLPQPVKNLAIFRGKEQNESIDLNDILARAFRWDDTPEREDFWKLINSDGDLREFKKKYGNKGEGVDAIINAPAVKVSKAKAPKLPPAPPVKTQEVKYVEFIFYPRRGGILNLKVDNRVELFSLTATVLSLLMVKNKKLNFSAITDLGTYTTEITVSELDTAPKVLRKLVEQFDTFVKPELNWQPFVDNLTDLDRIKLNNEILKDTILPKPAPAPAPVVAPKVEKPKPVKVEKPKPVKVEKQKPAPAVKTKVTKPKVEDDLSFLDDLDNIF